MGIWLSAVKPNYIDVRPLIPVILYLLLLPVQFLLCFWLVSFLDVYWCINNFFICDISKQLIKTRTDVKSRVSCHIMCKYWCFFHLAGILRSQKLISGTVWSIYGQVVKTVDLGLGNTHSVSTVLCVISGMSFLLHLYLTPGFLVSFLILPFIKQ